MVGMEDERSTNFYEDDEPVEKIVAAFEHGPHGLTAAPAGGQALDSAGFRLYASARFHLQPDGRSGQLAAQG